MNCPQCQTTLAIVDYEGVTVHTCETCGGEFVGSEEMGHIIRTRDEKFGDEMQQSLSERRPVYGIPDDENDREMPCPRCNETMQVLNYATDTGVCIDRCPGCGGMWLDHLELEKVQSLLERWSEEATEQVKAMVAELESARRDAADRAASNFSGSRFSFVNALINRVLN